MDRILREHVWKRSGSRCEYCQLQQAFADARHEIDQVIAEKHGGQTTLENLALACFHCNNHKGPNIAGIDSLSGQITRLFHPRSDQWKEHFRWQGPALVGITAVGRATVAVLQINVPDRLMHRMALIEEGIFP